MKNIKQLIKPLYIRWAVHKFCRTEYKYLVKNLGTERTFQSRDKLRYSLLLQCHIIEKGLSLDDVRLGFGVPKIIRLLNDLKEYDRRYKDQEMLVFVLSIVEQYIEFHKSNNAEVDFNIMRLYGQLNGKMDSNSRQSFQRYLGGIETKSSKELFGEFPYQEFAKSRHSIRTFTGEPVAKEIICKALEIAETTPSACNRQPWDIYVKTGKNNVMKILELQTGARQFKDKVSAIIIIASTANAFSITEGHQPYLNGGLYAMNLMYAFHSLGVGTIPLNLGIDNKRLAKIKAEAGITDASLPVLLLAIGHTPDTLKVACSKRFSYTEYTHFD